MRVHWPKFHQRSRLSVKKGFRVRIGLQSCGDCPVLPQDTVSESMGWGRAEGLHRFSGKCSFILLPIVLTTSAQCHSGTLISTWPSLCFKKIILGQQESHAGGEDVGHGGVEGDWAISSLPRHRVSN